MEPKREDELNDRVELEVLAEIIKEASYQGYKMAYEVAAIIISPNMRRNITTIFFGMVNL
jgi:hypothetical protein